MAVEVIPDISQSFLIGIDTGSIVVILPEQEAKVAAKKGWVFDATLRIEITPYSVIDRMPLFGFRFGRFAIADENIEQISDGVESLDYPACSENFATGLFDAIPGLSLFEQFFALPLIDAEEKDL